MTKTKYSVPWIDATIKRLVKKRHKLTFVLVRANQRTLMSRFITSGSEHMFRRYWEMPIDPYWKHVFNIFTFENDSSDPDTPKPEKIKMFWSFIKSLLKTRLESHLSEKTEFLRQILRKKANICNRQFQSAFKREDDSDPSSEGASPFSSMRDITLDPKGVAKLLDGLNVHKASGPDGLNARVLKECSNEISSTMSTRWMATSKCFSGL